jgi:hypothetical protein
VKKGKKLECKIEMKSGTLTLKTINLEKDGKRNSIVLTNPLQLVPGKPYTVTI